MNGDLDTARSVLRQSSRELLTRPNVTATGVGYKVTGGRRTKTLSIACSVVRKVSASALAAGDLVPASIQGVPTDVVETGRIRALQAPTGRFRPAPGGVSIGHRDITAGTLGCLVRKGGQTFILSNNHVLANCLDAATEILTEDGFTPFSDLRGDEAVATLNPKTGAIEYHVPTSVIRETYSGPMVHMKSAHVDQLVTPDHRVWARRVYKSGLPAHVPAREAHFVYASELQADMKKNRSVSYELQATGSWHCSAPAAVVLPAVQYVKGKNWNVKDPLPIDAYLELLGWYIAEGSAVCNSANGQRFISIRNTDQAALARIVALARECGFTPWRCQGAVVINSKQLYEYWKPLGHSKTKRIPKDVRDLPPEKLEILLRGYVAGDGCIDKADQLILSTASEGLASDLQEILLKMGRASTLRITHGSPYNPSGVYYHVRSKKRPMLRLQKTPKTVHYEGMVYCVRVENGIFMVRRNGRMAWTGNSNAAEIGDPILQPGPVDGGSLATDHIANLEAFVPVTFLVPEPPSECSFAGAVIAALNAGCQVIGSQTRYRIVSLQAQDNLVDAAIARPLNAADVKDEILGIGAIQGTAQGTLGLRVKKSGRTTGLTTGEILQVDVTVDVQYGAGQVARFTDQLMAGAMSQGGDSGSAVLDESNRLVGLLFAGSDTTTIINRIEHVFSALGVTR
jgi:hypothetical protein